MTSHVDVIFKFWYDKYYTFITIITIGSGGTELRRLETFEYRDVSFMVPNNLRTTNGSITSVITLVKKYK